MACERIITLCNGGETCSICADAVVAPAICDPDGGLTPTQQGAACEPITLRMCVPADCAVDADQVQLTLHRVRSELGELPYTAAILGVTEELTWVIPEDTLRPGWYVATLLLLLVGNPLLSIVYHQKFRVIACDESEDPPTCLSGNVADTVDPDATIFDCCP